MDTLIGILMELLLPFWVFLAANLAVAYTAYLLLVRYFYGSRLSERCTSFFMLGIAIVVLIETLAAALGILTYGVVLIFILACLLMALVLPGWKERPKYVLSFFDEIGLYIRTAWHLATYSLITKTLSLAVFAFAITLFSLNYQLPPFYGDLLNYHFPIPVIMYQMKSLLHYPQMMPSEHFYYPINGQLLALWLMLPFGKDFLAMSFQSLFPFLMMLTFFAILRRSNVAAPRSFIFSFIILVLPWIMMRSLLNRGIDEIFAYTIMLVFYYLHAYYQKPDLARLILLGISAGLFCGTKYPAILFMSGFSFIWLHIHIHKRSHLRQSSAPVGKSRLSFMSSTAGLVIVLLIFGGSTYIRNWLSKGSPFFPMFEYLAPDKTILNDLNLAENQGYYYGLFNWLKTKSFPFFYVLTVIATLFISSSILLLARLDKAKTDIQELVFLRSAAWGLAVISLVNLVLPMPHSRMVVVFPLVALAYGLASFRDWPIFSTKTLLPLYAVGCLFLLAINFLLPTVSFYEFYTQNMLIRAGILALISVALLILLSRSGLKAGWLKLTKAWRTTVALIAVLLISLFIMLEFKLHYEKTRPQFYANRFPPFYTWLETYTSHQGQNVLILDADFFIYLLFGADFQNRLTVFSPYEPRPKDEEAFWAYLDQNKVDLIAYNTLEIRNTHDLANIKIYIKDSRDLRNLHFYTPPEANWMELRPDRFTLLEQFGQTSVYQYHRMN